MLSANAVHVCTVLSPLPAQRTESNADRSLTGLQDFSRSLCGHLDFWDSKARQMLSAVELRGRASSVSASHSVIAGSLVVPSSACMPVQFQPHALIRAPQLSAMELTEQDCPSAQNCSVPVCGAGSISALHWGEALDQSPSAGQK